MARFTSFFLFLLFWLPAVAGDPRYFGLAPPLAPEPFTPPVLAASARLTCVSFAPGYRRAALSVMDADASGKVAGFIHESRRKGGEWSPATLIVGVSGEGRPAGEGAFSPDGRWFHFSSERAPGAPGRPRVFRAAVRHGRIQAPEWVPLNIPADAGAYYPRQLTNGDLLFTSRGPVGGDDLFIARARRGGFADPEVIPGDFNSARDDWDLIESRDGRLRIWVSAREGGQGRTDLYYSRRVRGAWTPARNLSAANSTAVETAPALSPDGKVLFFLRRVGGTDRMFWMQLPMLEAR
jgi:hypothetical protein